MRIRLLRTLGGGLLLAAVVISIGCSGRRISDVPEAPPTEPVPAPAKVEPEPAPAEPVKAAPPEPLTLQFLDAPEAAYYSNTGPAAIEGNEAEYLAVLERLLSGSGGTTDAAYPGLVRASREISRFIVQAPELPVDKIIRPVLHHCGIAEINPRFFTFGVTPSNLDEFKTALKTWLRESNRGARFNAYGLGLFRRPGDAAGEAIDVVTVLAVRRELLLDPVPKQTPHENRFYMSGSCPDGDCRLKMYLRFFGEAVFDSPIQVKDGFFRTEVQIPPAPAIYDLEITRQNGEEERILLGMRLFNQYDPPATLELFAKSESGCEASTECEDRIIEMANAERSDRKHARLLISSRLMQTARAHASDMLANHYQSIFDREGREVMLRLSDHGVSVIQAGEVVGSGYSLESVIAHFKESPSLVQFLSNPSMTHIGCGIAERRSEADVYYMASCIVATLIDPRDGKELLEAVYREFNRLREQDGGMKFKRFQELQHLANTAVADIVENPEKAREIQEIVSGEIEDRRLMKKRVNFGILTIYSLDQLGVNSSVRQIIDGGHTTLILGVKKELNPDKRYRGIFIYYMAFH